MFNFLRKKKDEISARDLRALYITTSEHCRDPKFYTDFDVPDTLPGRYALVVLHLFLLMDRLGMGSNASQTLFDIFFADMDRGLRENGVGDLAVPKRIKKMMKAFYEDIQLYSEAFPDVTQVEACLLQTIYAPQEKATQSVKKMAIYAIKQKEQLDDCAVDELTTDFTFKF